MSLFDSSSLRPIQAIRDGVIEATINHEQGYVQSREIVDIYTTREPMNAFHQRIEFCLKVHNESVKAMRYPPKKYNEELETAQVREGETACFHRSQRLSVLLGTTRT